MEIPGRATTRLRYRFANLDQARAHLRESEGRWLFFYRDEKLRVLPYAPVCMELSFEDGTAPRLVHGQVLDSLEGSGTWIQTLDARSIFSPAGYTRGSRRWGCDLPVEAHAPGIIESGRLLDLGEAGARIGGLSHLVPGQEVDLRLLSPDRLTFRDLSYGRVAWAHEGELGVQFDAGDSVGRSAVTRLLIVTAAQWRHAWESVHPQFCCKAEGVIQPETPRLRRPDDVTGKIAL